MKPSDVEAKTEKWHFYWDRSGRFRPSKTFSPNPDYTGKKAIRRRLAHLEKKRLRARSGK